MSKNSQQLEILTQLKNSSMPETIESVKELLNQEGGVNVNDPFSKGHTPLQTAVNFGSTDLVAQLLNRKADVNIQGRLDNTALHNAVANQNEDLVELLIEAKADVNQPALGGRTPLHLACALFSNQNPSNIVKQLIEAEANVNQPDRRGNTALYEAVANQNEDLVKQLIVEHVNQGGEQAISGLTPDLLEIYQRYQLEELANIKIPTEEFKNSTVYSEFNQIEEVNNQDDLNVVGEESMD